MELGRGAEAIPYLEERLNNFDDRDATIRKTLAEAQAQVDGDTTDKQPKVKPGDEN